MHKKLKSSSASAPHKQAGKAAALVNRSTELCAPTVDLETSSATAQPAQAQPVTADLETSSTASRQTETRPVKQLSLHDFVREGWSLLEPVSTLIWNWHLDLICDYLTQIRDGKFRPLHPELEGIIFNVPPRTMKSLLITVFFPIWAWITKPSLRFMFVSYSEKLSTQHSILRRSLIESEWYKKDWGGQFSISRDQNVKSHYENSARGAMFSTGMQSTATGMGGDILIFDDPLNPEQAISQVEREAVNLRFDTTFRSRINDPATGVKIIIMQRLHELDLTGHVLARESSRWKHISLPAVAEKDEGPWRLSDGRHLPARKAGALLWSERLPQSFLDSQRVGMGSWAFNGQYQQRPAPLDGGIIKRQWVRFYRQLPEKFEFMVQSWDCTFSGGHDNDFVAGQVWARSGGKYFMLPYRTYERLDFGPTMAAIKSCHARFPQAHAVLIEDKANGPAIISELQKEIPGVVAVNPEGGKLARAQATAPLWEAGSIELPDPQVFGITWMEDYLHNMCAFPKAAHDDDVDATSQALIYMRSRLGGGIVDFYRQQATAELPQKSAGNASAPSRNFYRRGPQAPSPAIEDSALTRSVLVALTEGSQIQCNAKQYPAIRKVLASAAEESADTELPASLSRNELERLDQFFQWKQ